MKTIYYPNKLRSDNRTNSYCNGFRHFKTTLKLRSGFFLKNIYIIFIYFILKVHILIKVT